MAIQNMLRLSIRGCRAPNTAWISLRSVRLPGCHGGSALNAQGWWVMSGDEIQGMQLSGRLYATKKDKRLQKQKQASAEEAEMRAEAEDDVDFDEEFGLSKKGKQGKIPRTTPQINSEGNNINGAFEFDFFGMKTRMEGACKKLKQEIDQQGAKLGLITPAALLDNVYVRLKPTDLEPNVNTVRLDSLAAVSVQGNQLRVDPYDSTVCDKSLLDIYTH